MDLHSLRAAGLAFELKSKGWVMRDLAVHMGPNGLGLQLDVRHGGVKVDGLTPTPPGVSNSAQVWATSCGTVYPCHRHALLLLLPFLFLGSDLVLIQTLTVCTW